MLHSNYLVICFIATIIVGCSCIYESPTVDECHETLSCIESAAQLIHDLGLDIDLSKCSSNPLPTTITTTTTTTTTEPTTTTTTTTPTTTTATTTPTTTTTTTTPTTTTTTTPTTTTTTTPPPPPTATTDFPVFARAFNSNHTGGCANDFMECACLIGLIGEALSVKFRFGCDVSTTNHESCDLWKYFELYLLCNATEELIPDKRLLWDTEKCNAEAKHLNKCCGRDKCTISHKPDNPCKHITSPVECLNEAKCGYCFDPCFCSVDGARCNTKRNLDVIGCKTRSLEDSASSEPVDIDTACNNNKSVTISIAPGQKKNATFAFQRQKFPLDFYYAMDFTGTMEDDRKFLEKMAPNLVSTLEGLTTDLRVGFGSFLDKPIAPFGVPAEDRHAGKGYAYKNTMPLTKNTQQLQQVMRDTETIGVRAPDVPEDAGDALIQAAECTEAIGWREEARRIVFVASDRKFHVAGDGAANNVHFPSPYIHGCYLDSNGKYANEVSMGYPSIAQIAEAVEKAKIRVIFATEAPEIAWYNTNTAPIKGSAIATLSGDSSNIIDIVTQTFLQFDSKLELEKSDTTDTVKFRFFSNCAKKDAEETETKICDNLTPEGQVKFTVEVDMAECPKDKSDIETKVSFNPVGIPDFKQLAIAHVC